LDQSQSRPGPDQTAGFFVFDGSREDGGDGQNQGATGPMTDRALRYHTTRHFRVESGAVLPEVRQAYYLDGTLSPERDNLILILHALTGSPDACGDWWSGVVGPGKALDTNRYAVLAPNLLGSCYGTTGPGDPAEPFPAITPRDMARLAGELVRSLGV